MAYPHNKECEWVINQPIGYIVTLNFLSFDIEGGTCRYDFVEVCRHGACVMFRHSLHIRNTESVISDRKINNTLCRSEMVPRSALL